MRTGVRSRMGGMNGTKEKWSALVHNCNCVPVIQSVIWTTHSVISDRDHSYRTLCLLHLCNISSMPSSLTIPCC